MSGFVEPREPRGDFGKLHERRDALHHARAAGGGDDDERGARLERTINGTSDGLADNGAHGAADEAVLHRGDDDFEAVDLADGVDDGVIEAGLLLFLLKAIFVGFEVDEAERVSGAKAGVDELIAGVQQHIDALAGADLEVMAAVRTDLQVGFEVGVEDRFAALRTLGPQTFGANLVVGGRDDLVVIALEPGHRL